MIDYFFISYAERYRNTNAPNNFGALLFWDIGALQSRSLVVGFVPAVGFIAILRIFAARQPVRNGRRAIAAIAYTAKRRGSDFLGGKLPADFGLAFAESLASFFVRALLSDVLPDENGI